MKQGVPLPSEPTVFIQTYTADFILIVVPSDIRLYDYKTIL